MITVCSIDDKQYFKGTVYRTTIGSSRGMGKYPNLECLAPTWELVMGHKQGRISDQQYKDGYRVLLAQRWPEVHTWLMSELKSDQDITLLCYCAEGKFCHRRILAQLIKHYRPDLEVVLH